MVKVDTPARFSTLVNEFKKTHQTVQSNCFFLPSEVTEMTNKQKLCAQQQKDGLIFFVEEDACSRLYYFLDEKAKPVMPAWNKPVLLDYVFRGEENTALEAAGCAKWQTIGFTPYKRYNRMECTRESFSPPAHYREKQSDFQITDLEPKDFKEVSKLWKSSLDVYSTFLPDESEYTEACEKGEIIGVRLEDGTPGAVNRAIKKGRLSFLQHLAVSPKLRGRGMGKALFSATVDFVLDRHQAERVNFWVDEENTRAVEMYKKAGFANDGMISRQYILEV